MGAQFFTPGTKRIRDALHDAFGPVNGPGNAVAYGGLFSPTSSYTLADIADTNHMDIPLTNDPHWPSLHGRFKGFLTALQHTDPTTHASIKQAMYGALTANPVMPMKFYVAHQAGGYNFVSWTEEDDSGTTWLNCLLFCPQMGGAIAKRLHRVIRRAQERGRRAKPGGRGHRTSKKSG